MLFYQSLIVDLIALGEKEDRSILFWKVKEINITFETKWGLVT